MRQSKKSAKRTNDRLQAAALRMARRCRHIIQGCLREEKGPDADQEFYAVIIEELQRLGVVKVGAPQAMGGGRDRFP